MGTDLVSRQELYEMVWSMPMIKVAQQFKVSGSYLARVCSALQVPRPERGHWAKLAVGKAPEKPALPEAQPGDQLNWSREGGLQSPPRPRIVARPPGPRGSRLARPVSGVHGLIRDARGYYGRGYKVDEGQHLRPYKRLMVDVTASKAGLDKALAFANDLFNALESAGHRVVISTPADHFARDRIDEHEKLPEKQRRDAWYGYGRLWSPQRPTVVYVGSIAFGLAIIEMSESLVLRYVNGKYIRESNYKPAKAVSRSSDYGWTTTKDIPCGRLRLVVYAPYGGVSWSLVFQETEAKALTKDIQEIVKLIESSTEVLVEKVKEAQREAEIRRQQWEAQQERWRQEEDRRRVAESIQESRDQLDQVIREWARVISL
jgi:Asp-tRNA(Asn)/Glu-tRNA(Gln) amidotransferase C subunit